MRGGRARRRHGAGGVGQAGEQVGRVLGAPHPGLGADPHGGEERRVQAGRDVVGHRVVEALHRGGPGQAPGRRRLPGQAPVTPQPPRRVRPGPGVADGPDGAGAAEGLADLAVGGEHRPRGVPAVVGDELEVPDGDQRSRVRAVAVVVGGGVDLLGPPRLLVVEVVVRPGGGVVAQDGEPVEHPDRDQRVARVPGRDRRVEHPERAVRVDQPAQQALGQDELVGAAVPTRGVTQGQGSEVPVGVTVGHEVQHQRGEGVEPGPPVGVGPLLRVVHGALDGLAQRRVGQQGGAVEGPRAEGHEQLPGRRVVVEAGCGHAQPGDRGRGEARGERLVAPGQQDAARSGDDPAVGQRHRQARELRARPGCGQPGQGGEAREDVAPPRHRPVQPGERVDQRRGAHAGHADRGQGGGVPRRGEAGVDEPRQDRREPLRERGEDLGRARGVEVEDLGAGGREVLGTGRGRQPRRGPQHAEHRVAQGRVDRRRGQRRRGDEGGAILGGDGPARDRGSARRRRRGRAR